jgi:hypothetical protein
MAPAGAHTHPTQELALALSDNCKRTRFNPSVFL